MARWVCALILALTIGAASLASAQPDSAGSDASHQTTLALEALDAGDVERALSILRPLARAGEPSARHNLGVLFARGLGVNQDYIAAESLFQMAAEQGYPPSFYSLGIMYAQGEGVPPDLIEAYKWFTLAKRKLQETAGHWSARMISLEESEGRLVFVSSGPGQRCLGASVRARRQSWQLPRSLLLRRAASAAGRDRQRAISRR
jgi:TPR repeat protein